MRRQHVQPSGGGFPTGLRFYAPLSSTSDTMDHVSGISPTNGTAQISWDNAEGAFHVATTAPGQLAWIYNIPNVNVYAEPYRYTVVARVKINSFTGTADILTVGKTGNEGTSSAFMETHRHTGITTGSWHTIAMTLNNHALTFYLNGSVVRTSTTPSNYASCYPGNWSTNDKKNNITVCGGFINAGNYHYDIYIRDVMVFERCLTQSEIQQL